MPQPDPLDELYATLARRWPNYRARDGQRAMSEAVAHTVERGGTLLVEAGTGVGKSLAYLLPALLAVQHGQRTLIATSHKPLQDQLDSKDLPLVYQMAKQLGWQLPKWVTLKGIANYLCLEAQDEELQHGQLLGLDKPMRQFVAWQDDGGVNWDGDWESAPSFVSAEMRNRLSSSSDECLRERCPHFAPCYALNKRRAAASADIVITNHALLALDLRSGGHVLPGPFDAYIIDEGHLWEESVTRALGAEISSTAISRLLGGEQVRRLDGELRDRAAAAFARLDAGVSLILRGANDAAEGKALLTGPLVAGRKLAGMLAKMAEQIRPRAAKRAAFVAAVDLSGLSDTATADALADMFGGDDPDAAMDDDEGYSQLSDAEAAAVRAAKRLESAATRLSFIAAMGRNEYVYYAEQVEGGYTLNAMPVSIADKIADWWEQRACIVTSATLSDGESFDFFAARLGIYRPHTLIVASPFDYKKRTRFLNWPVGGQEEAGAKYYDLLAERIALLAGYADGRALALFTSHRALDGVHKRLLQRMTVGGPTLMRQGEATQLQLVQRFQAAERALLLGTRSWWQGVDLPGLRMVIMDKLPFPQLGDPLVAARMAALEADGYSSFGSYTLPSALISFRQGLGRLMRREEDWGMVVSLDERIANKSYGPRFINALPGGMKPIIDPAIAVEWLRRKVR